MEKMSSSPWLLLALLLVVVTTIPLPIASDPASLQDFCVADNMKSNAFVNGLVCKNPELATADDFFLSGLDKPRITANRLGFNVTLVSTAIIPGLNTLGISLARAEFGPCGVNPPHTHPRATELFTVLEGTVHAGFVTANPENRLFAKVLNKGDVFVFPQGLIHFQFNSGETNAITQSYLSSHNPGINTIADALFGSVPLISRDVLAKAFGIDQKTVDWIQSQFWMNN